MQSLIQKRLHYIHQIGHYIRSPYALKNNIGKKFIPNIYTDLGQGLLELINNINNNEKTF